jgi:hypothetical protein
MKTKEGFLRLKIIDCSGSSSLTFQIFVYYQNDVEIDLNETSKEQEFKDFCSVLTIIFVEIKSD